MSKNRLALAILAIILLGLTGTAVMLLGLDGKPVAPVAVAPPTPADQPLYAAYSFGHDDTVIDFGIQPLAVPTGTLPEIMRRDVLLRRALGERGKVLRPHAFLKGGDVNFFAARGDLEVMSAGDMPTVTATVTQDVAVMALSKMAFASIIANRVGPITMLKGKRIGNASGSSAHHVLLTALDQAGLREADVRLVPMAVTEMIDALASGRIDAFAAWEPTPSLALARHSEFSAIYRRMTYSYLYMARRFLDSDPEAARLVLAGHVRAINWMRMAQANLEQACRWTVERARDFSGRTDSLTWEQCAEITRRDLLDVSPQAKIPDSTLTPDGLVRSQVLFLQEQGKIPEGVRWEDVRAKFNPAPLDEILADPDRYQLWEFVHDG